MKVVSPPVVMTQKREGIMSYSYICWINQGKTPSSYPRYGIHVLYTSSPVLLQVPWAPGLPGYPQNQLVSRCTISLWDDMDPGVKKSEIGFNIRSTKTPTVVEPMLSTISCFCLRCFIIWVQRNHDNFVPFLP